MTGRTTVLGKGKGRCGGSCVTDAFTERAWWPVLSVGANRSERKSERADTVDGAWAAGSLLMRLRREQPGRCHLPEINDGWSVGEVVDDRIRWSWRKKGFGVAVHSSGLR